MALIDDFKTRFPEFDTAVVDQYFPIVEPVYPCYFGGNIDLPCDKEATLNLIAHLITLQTRSSSSSLRNTASKTAGSVSVSYEADSTGRASAGFYNTTKYGQQFLMLTQHNIGAYFV